MILTTKQEEGLKIAVERYKTNKSLIHAKNKRKND